MAALLDGTDQEAAGTFIAVVREGEYPGTFPEARLRSLDLNPRSRRSVAVFAVLLLLWGAFLLLASIFWDLPNSRADAPARDQNPVLFGVPFLVGALALVVSREIARWGPAWVIIALLAGGVGWAVATGFGMIEVAALVVLASVVLSGSRHSNGVLGGGAERAAWWSSVEPLLTDHVHVRARVVDIPQVVDGGGLAGNAVLVVESERVPGRQWFMVCHRDLTGIRDLQVRVGDTMDLFYSASSPHLAVLRPVAVGLTRPSALRRARDAVLLPRDVAGRATRRAAVATHLQERAPQPTPALKDLDEGSTASSSVVQPASADSRARARLAEELVGSSRTALTLILPTVGGEAPAEIPRARLASLDPRHGAWRTVVSVVVLNVLWMSALIGADAWWGVPGETFRAGIDASWVRWSLAVVPWIVGLRLLVWSRRILGWVRAWPAHLVFAALLVGWAVHDGWRLSGYWYYVAILLYLTLSAAVSRRGRSAWARRMGAARADHVATVARIEDILWAGADSWRRASPVLVVSSEHAPHGRWFVVRNSLAPGVADVRFAVGDPLVVLSRPSDPEVVILRPVPESTVAPPQRRTLSQRLQSVLRSFKDVVGISQAPRARSGEVEPAVAIPAPEASERRVFGPGS